MKVEQHECEQGKTLREKWEDLKFAVIAGACLIATIPAVDYYPDGELDGVFFGSSNVHYRFGSPPENSSDTNGLDSFLEELSK